MIEYEAVAVAVAVAQAKVVVVESTSGPNSVLCPRRSMMAVTSPSTCASAPMSLHSCRRPRARCFAHVPHVRAHVRCLRRRQARSGDIARTERLIGRGWPELRAA